MVYPILITVGNSTDIRLINKEEELPKSYTMIRVGVTEQELNLIKLGMHIALQNFLIASKRWI